MKKNKRIIILAVLFSLGSLVLLSSLLNDVSASSTQQRYNRLVIKQGTLEIMVEDTDAAVERALDIANTYNGYVLKQRVWDGEDRRYRYADITFGMPADDFEGLTQGLKTLGSLLDETADGQDVTDEYGDQISHLESLYTTQERMRTFLEQADTITDTFTVHEELLKIEAEIGEVQGRANYLENQAAAGALTVKIVPFMPTPTPTPTLTPTPTMTPTPLPTPAEWRPGDTATAATVILQNTSQSVADVIINFSILWCPWLLLIAFVIYPIWFVIKHFPSSE
jgi:hypothetical protein